MGCVLVGSKTIDRDDPELTARIPGVVNQPLRVVLDPVGHIVRRHKVYTDGRPTVRFVLFGRESLPDDIGLHARSEDGFDLREVLSRLFDRGVTGVLVEGGAQTLASFFRQGLVDRLEKFTSPTKFEEGLFWLGEDPPSLQLELVSEAQVGDDLHQSFKVLGPREH
jgi:diaminohydroxyphosphoribosylaminopyrimidine deaminase/5-amino-6-(5-phosphoribosylamino)uracil reductase